MDPKSPEFAIELYKTLHDILDKRDKARETLKPGERLYAWPGEEFQSLSAEQLQQQIDLVMTKKSPLSKSRRDFLNGLFVQTIIRTSKNEAPVEEAEVEEVVPEEVKETPADEVKE